MQIPPLRCGMTTKGAANDNQGEDARGERVHWPRYWRYWGFHHAGVAGEHELRVVVLELCLGELRLRALEYGLGTHHGQVVIDAGSEALGGVAERLGCEVDVATSNFHQLTRAFDIQHAGANLRFDGLAIGLDLVAQGDHLGGSNFFSGRVR